MLRQALRRAGANVALGTDGTCSNNTLDMVAEMKLAALLAKAEAKDAAAMPAIEAIRMATLNGAKALGLESKIGGVVRSLSVAAPGPCLLTRRLWQVAGKEADLIAINLDTVESLPMYDVVSHLVYTITRDQVTDVWVSGRRLLQGRELTTIDEGAVKATAVEWQKKVAAPS